MLGRKTEALFNLRGPIKFSSWNIYVVSDAKNCGPKTATFTITEPPVMDVSLISKTDLCVLDNHLEQSL
jgi:hypothetical protein